MPGSTVTFRKFLPFIWKVMYFGKNSTVMLESMRSTLCLNSMNSSVVGGFVRASWSTKLNFLINITLEGFGAGKASKPRRTGKVVC